MPVANPTYILQAAGRVLEYVCGWDGWDYIVSREPCLGHHFLLLPVDHTPTPGVFMWLPGSQLLILGYCKFSMACSGCSFLDRCGATAKKKKKNACTVKHGGKVKVNWIVYIRVGDMLISKITSR